MKIPKIEQAAPDPSDLKRRLEALREKADPSLDGVPASYAPGVTVTTAIGSPPLGSRAYAAARTDPPPRPIPVTTCAKDVKAVPVSYLWQGRIPAGRLSFFMGLPDQGKSTLMSIITATITTGGPWPDCPEPAEKGSVLYLQAEESVAEDIAERLESYGADASKVHYVDGVDFGDGEPRPFSIGRDSTPGGALEAALDRHKDVRAVIFDPFDAYLGETSSKSTEDVYQSLLPLKNLAERRKVAVILVAHPNKNGEQSIIHRLAGSKAFAALARALWYVSEDPGDPTRRMISFVKGNPKGMNRKPLAWSLHDGLPVWDCDAGDMRARHVDFLLQRNLKIESLKAKRGPRPTASKDAASLILGALAEGTVLRSRLKKRVVSADVSESSFGKALKQLVAEGRVVRTPLGDGRKGVMVALADGPDLLPFAPPPDTPPETARDRGSDATP